jgi:hypothetical protein
MPATSKKQQRLMGIVHALQAGKLKPSQVSGQAKRMAKQMDPQDAEDFAKTKHKGLPEKSAAIANPFTVLRMLKAADLNATVRKTEQAVRAAERERRRELESHITALNKANKDLQANSAKAVATANASATQANATANELSSMPQSPPAAQPLYGQMLQQAQMAAQEAK